MSPDAAGISIRAATHADTPAVLALLREAELPLDGVPEVLTDLLVAEQPARDAAVLVGAVALERYGTAALLRSTVVAPALRGTGLGERLVRTVLDAARAQAVRDVVILTTTAEDWFPRFGFVKITRAEVPVTLQVSQEFQFACPASATVMHLRM